MHEHSVCYLMSGAAHAPYLATSVVSLRRWWTGRVRIHAWPESLDIAVSIARDPAVRAEVIPVFPDYRGRNDQFIHKISVMQQTDGRSNLYLDADTLVVGQLGELFDSADFYGFAATQFSDWTTTGSVIQNRIKKLYEFPEIDKELIGIVMGQVLPSVNGGVFACSPNNTILSLWHTWSSIARSIFIADECVLHLMVPLFQPQERLVVLPGKFNSSPKYMQDDGSVRIWHGHGDCFTRPNKSIAGFRMWITALADCLESNVGGIRDWLPTIQHKYLTPLLQKVCYEVVSLRELRCVCGEPTGDRCEEVAPAGASQD